MQLAKNILQVRNFCQQCPKSTLIQFKIPFLLISNSFFVIPFTTIHFAHTNLQTYFGNLGSSYFRFTGKSVFTVNPRVYYSPFTDETFSVPWYYVCRRGREEKVATSDAKYRRMPKQTCIFYKFLNILVKIDTTIKLFCRLRPEFIVVSFAKERLLP